MSLNKFALIRYKTIDHCLQNRFRKWTLEDLMEACSDALYEFEGVSTGVSKRTIQLDIQNMRSEKLGYNAPIVVKDKKYYCYEDKNYSITNSPITDQDKETLKDVLQILKQFGGFNYFQEMTGMVARLEDKLQQDENKKNAYIEFEQNELLKGLEHLEPIYKAIANQQALSIHYQSFKSRSPTMLEYCPYMLKEYRNRWFVLGLSLSGNGITLLALDRIIEFSASKSSKFKKAKFDVHSFFSDVIGVSKNVGQPTHEIVMKVDSKNAPYLLTKPMHPTQKVIQHDSDGLVFSIHVVWNFELEREILGFGEQMQVLSPRRFRKRIMNRMNRALSIYEEEIKD